MNKHTSRLVLTLPLALLTTALWAQSSAGFFDDAEKARLTARNPGCQVAVIKLPENKPVALISNTNVARVKVGNTVSEQYVHFRNSKEVKFGGLTLSPGGDFVVEAALVKSGEEGLCQPIGCRSIPAKMVMDVSAKGGKSRILDSDVLVQDACGRETTKRLMN